MAPEAQASIGSRIASLSPELAEYFMAGKQVEVEAALTDL